MDSTVAQMDYSADLYALAQLVAAPLDVHEVLQKALDALARVVPYDLAAVFRLSGSDARVVAAAGPLAAPAVRKHRIDLRRFPTIQRALETRRPIALEREHHESNEGDPYDDVLELPHGHSCMVVPLFAGEHDLGLVTLDRRVCETYSQQILETAGVYGQLMSLTIYLAELADAMSRRQRQIDAHNRLLIEESGIAEKAVAWLEDSREPVMQELVSQAHQVAASSLPVLILGETGTGKEVLAQAIHDWSPRAARPFVKLNCSAIPEALAESELFGHAKGAFSGADRSRPGRFVTANGGTLLLDEIGDMPLAAQAKLLRVLQEGTFEPVGSDRTVKVNVRVVAATHKDLEQAVRQGQFREDLYYRLAVFPLRLPPLRERRGDIVRIAQSILQRSHAQTGRGPWSLSDAARAGLEAVDWPGNVRELHNVLERALILKPAGIIEPRHLGLDDLARPPSRPMALPAQLLSWEDNERAYLERLLESAGGRIYGPGGAAALAGLPPTTLRSKLVRHGLR